MNIKNLIETCEQAIEKNTTVVLSIKKGSTLPPRFPAGHLIFTAAKETVAHGVKIPAGARVMEFEADEVINWLYTVAMERKHDILVPRSKT